MHFAAQGSLLKPIFRAAASVAPPKSDRPILRNMLLTTNEDGLEISVTDQQVSVWMQIPATELEVKAHGRAVANAANLDKITRTSVKHPIEMRLNARNLGVKAGGASFKLPIEDPTDFPKIHRFSTKRPAVRVKASTFLEMVKRTAYCAHESASRYAMHGLFVEVADGKLNLVATNGQRMGYCSAPHGEVVNHDPTTEFKTTKTILATSASALGTIVSDPDTEVELQFTEGALHARGDRGEIWLRGLAGQFPPYRRGLPQAPIGKVAFERAGLIEMMNQLTLIKHPGTAFVDVTLSAGQMVVETDVENAGATRVEREAAWSGEEVHLCLNPVFLLEAAKAMRGTHLDLEVEGEMRPTVLRERREDDMTSLVVYAVVQV